MEFAFVPASVQVQLLVFCTQHTKMVCCHLQDYSGHVHSLGKSFSAVEDLSRLGSGCSLFLIGLGLQPGYTVCAEGGYMSGQQRPDLVNPFFEGCLKVLVLIVNIFYLPHHPVNPLVFCLNCDLG